RALVALGLLLMLYALFYLRSYTALETEALGERLRQGSAAAQQLGLPAEEAALPPGTLEDWAELRARQVDWSALFAAVLNGAGGAVHLSGLTQRGYTASIAGQADPAPDADAYPHQLR